LAAHQVIVRPFGPYAGLAPHSRQLSAARPLPPEPARPTTTPRQDPPNPGQSRL